MKIDLKALFAQANSLAGFFWTAVMIAAVFCMLNSSANATVVQTTNRIINNGPSDFGSGTHSGGGPSGSATITYDWTPVAGQVIFTGRVRGTVYWDSLVSSGCARLTIRYRNAANANLAVRNFDECGPGGNANDAANKTAVDDSFGSVNLSHIVLTTAEIVNGNAINSTSITITQVTERNYPVTIQNGVADFGDGPHAFGFPQEPGHIIFRRNAGGTVASIVDGILYYDSFDDNSCSQMVLDRRNINGAVINQQVMLNCGPGDDANNAANQFFVSNNTFSSGNVFDVRLNVSNTAFPANAVINIFGYAGFVGDFEVEPVDAVAEVNDPINYAFTWTVPEPLNWHDLNTLEFRVMDGSNAIMHIKFEEAGNLISVFNESTGRFGKSFPVGSNKKLQTRYATLDLGATTVGPVNSALGTGPNSPTVRLDLGLRFKASTAGQTYTIEVAASDDLGNQDPFTLAGTLAVPD